MDALTDLAHVYRYHDATKHHFNRFAPSLGYLDWASQPRPFRSFEGAPEFSLFKPPGPFDPPALHYDRLYADRVHPPLPISAASLGRMLRHSLGLSAWKAFKGSRWSLRVNPSSGNLHPTEAYFVTGPLPDFGGTPGVWHYASDRHALERRCAFEPADWHEPADAFLVVLTSIHWRESWKYGERAFRYCQHDLGHAVAALSFGAALCGWRVTMRPQWPHRAVAAIAGIDRDEDYIDAEREEPACVLRVAGEAAGHRDRVDEALVDAARRGRWFGRASQLSEDHVRWTIIDEVARATADPGHAITAENAEHFGHAKPFPTAKPASSAAAVDSADRGFDATSLLLQRRSALAFDGESFIPRAAFLRMLSRALPGAGAPWDAMWWAPAIHLAVFVHRVDGVAPGLYLLTRADAAIPRLREALDPAFAWTETIDGLPLWLLQAGDYRLRSQRVSCDQAIAADGFFSLGMIADFDAGLLEHGPSFYRHLFWESGVVGQVLYLEAEAAGARATGIGCFFDDPVHELLGISAAGGHAFQSLYHFTVGMPIEDARLTTEPGYLVQG